MNAKKLLALFLAFVMLLSLCACGTQDAVETDPKETVADEPTETQQDTTGETDAAPAEITNARKSASSFLAFIVVAS